MLPHITTLKEDCDMKKLLALSLACTMALGMLAGCSQNNAGSGSAASGSAGTAASADAGSGKALSGKVVYWSMYTEMEPEALAIQQAADMFMNDYPDCEVEIQWIGRSNQDVVGPALEGGEQIDILDNFSYDKSTERYMDITDMMNGPALGQEDKTVAESILPVLSLANQQGQEKAVTWRFFGPFLAQQTTVLRRVGPMEPGDEVPDTLLHSGVPQALDPACLGIALLEQGVRAQGRQSRGGQGGAGQSGAARPAHPTQLPPGGRDQARLLLRSRPEGHLNPVQQRTVPGGLHNVVAGPQGEGVLHGGVVGDPGEHQDLHFPAGGLLPQSSEHLQSAHFGHHQVQKQQVGRLGVDPRQTTHAVPGHPQHLQSVDPPQKVRQQYPRALIVFQDQDANGLHGLPPPRILLDPPSDGPVPLLFWYSVPYLCPRGQYPPTDFYAISLQMGKKHGPA